MVAQTIDAVACLSGKFVIDAGAKRRERCA
jgi:hypothetical protein